MGLLAVLCANRFAVNFVPTIFPSTSVNRAPTTAFRIPTAQRTSTGSLPLQRAVQPRHLPTVQQVRQVRRNARRVRAERFAFGSWNCSKQQKYEFILSNKRA